MKTANTVTAFPEVLTVSRSRATHQRLQKSARWFLLVAALGLLSACKTAMPGITARPTLGAAPATAATGVPINVTLSWQAVPDAKGYDIYFGSEGSPAYQCRVSATTFLLETLSAGHSYRWRVDPVMTDGAQRGEILNFMTTAKADRDAMFAWPIRIADSVRARFPDSARLGGWNYTQGMVLDALYGIAARTGRAADFAYVQQWLDRYITPAGIINAQAIPPELHSLDRFRPGPALLWTYQRTKDEKYLKAATYIARQLDAQPTTSDGGYWHRSTYPNQMWLDGIYMADVFSVEYAAIANEPKYFDEAVRQVTTIAKHTRDPKTGLFYHGWDETKTRPWANKETGTSPEFWGRAIGWYGMAMADVLDWLPADHPGRKQVLPIFQAYCAALLKYEDHDTGMWYQIVDKPDGPKNYVETSCSLMYAYAMARGAQRGWLPPEYLEHARRATRGVLNHKIELKPDGTMDILGTVVVGTLGGNGGFYDTYMNDRVVPNDQKSIGAFMYLSMALSETANDTGPASREFPRRAP
jgi:unsaturated rhamnogalacturonyl hydrolase